MITPEYIQKIFDEVVGSDSYRLKRIAPNDLPDVIYDLGANIGAFATACRVLFPFAIMICVEPDRENFERLSQTMSGLSRTVLIHAGIGRKQLRRWEGLESGLHRFASAEVGFPADGLAQPSNAVSVDVPSVMLPKLVATYGGANILVKMDMEGAESEIIADAESMDVLKLCHYIVGELHFVSADRASRGEAYGLRLKWLNDMQKAGYDVQADCWENGATFWMRKA